MRVAVLALIPGGLLALGAGVASAQGTVHAAESDAVTFGLWGPVGLVAVALGIVGMTAGVVRQRRNARASAVDTVPPVCPETLLTETARSEAPTRPQLSPVPRR
jgi:hypothetical protein